MKKQILLLIAMVFVITISRAQSIPNSYLWLLPNSGHSTPIFYKEKFNAEIDNFFKTPYRKIEGFGRFN